MDLPDYQECSAERSARRGCGFVEHAALTNRVRMLRRLNRRLNRSWNAALYALRSNSSCRCPICKLLNMSTSVCATECPEFSFGDQ